MDSDVTAADVNKSVRKQHSNEMRESVTRKEHVTHGGMLEKINQFLQLHCRHFSALTVER